MFRRFNTKTKIIINAVLLLVMVACYGGFIWGAKYFEQKIPEMRMTLSDSYSNEKNLSSIQSFLDRTDVQETKSRILSSDDVVGFIEMLERLVAPYQGSIDAVSPSGYQGVDSGKWEAFSAVISASGSWEEMYALLLQLEHIPYRSQLVKVNIEQATDESKLVYWRGEFTLNVLKEKNHE